MTLYLYIAPVETMRHSVRPRNPTRVLTGALVMRYETRRHGLIVFLLFHEDLATRVL